MSGKTELDQRIFALLRETSAQLDETVAQLEESQKSTEHWKKRFWEANDKYLTLLYHLQCEDCRRLGQEGETVELCHECSAKQQDVHDLERQVKYWHSGYERLLELLTDRHDGRSDDDTNERL